MASSKGLVACEKKVLAWRTFDTEVKKLNKKTEKRFLELKEKDARYTGQLLSVTKLTDIVVETKLFYLSGAQAGWVLLHSDRPGWRAVRKQLRTFIAPTGSLKGCIVASVGSFLEATGKDCKAAWLKVPQWTNGSLLGISKSSIVHMKLKQHTGGQGWVGSVQTLRRLNNVLP